MNRKHIKYTDKLHIIKLLRNYTKYWYIRKTDIESIEMKQTQKLVYWNESYICIETYFSNYK